MGNPRDPRAIHAPGAYAAQCALEAALPALIGDDLREVARHRVAMSLGQVEWTGPGDDPIAVFADQFVIDVASVDLAPLTSRLGAYVGPFVQTLWVLDMGLRTDIALEKLFDGPCPPRTATAVFDFSTAFDEFLRAVARLQNLDPITSELVRIRGARFHNCRLCQSLRTASALRQGADETMFDKIDRYESSDLDERYKVALRLTDAIIGRPAYIDSALVEQVHAHFSDAEVVELVCDVMRNAANKIAVAFGADAPNVTEGVELYDVLPDGNLVYGLSSIDG